MCVSNLAMYSVIYNFHSQLEIVQILDIFQKKVQMPFIFAVSIHLYPNYKVITLVQHGYIDNINTCVILYQQNLNFSTYQEARITLWPYTLKFEQHILWKLQIQYTHL